MENKENVIEELKKIYPSDKKKKKFVYLDKYDAYRKITDNKIKSIEISIHVLYTLIAIIAVSICILYIK